MTLKTGCPSGMPLEPDPGPRHKPGLIFWPAVNWFSLNDMGKLTHTGLTQSFPLPAGRSWGALLPPSGGLYMAKVTATRPPVS